MEEFVQGFRRKVRESRYKKEYWWRILKKKMSKVVKRKLIRIERPLRSIK